MLEFQQSEQIASHRNWVIVLVDSADGVTGKTGQTGKAYLSKNGSTPFLSTNSIVEVDSVNMPGHYYLALTAGELDTLGTISLSIKTSATLAFHDRAIVSYNDPYARQGGFAMGGSGSSSKISKSQAQALLQDIRKVVKEEIAAVEKDENEPYDDTAIMAKVDAVLEAVNKEEVKEEIDFSPILEAINSIPKPADYSKAIKSLTTQVSSFSKQMDSTGFVQAVKDFQAKMEVSTQQLNTSLDEVEKIKAGVTKLQGVMDKFSSTLSEQSDMDKRFDQMSEAFNRREIEKLSAQMTKLSTLVTTSKFDILDEVSKLLMSAFGGKK